MPVGVNPLTPNSIFQLVAVPYSVQDKSACDLVIFEAVALEGGGQVLQLTVASQPER